jgi:hypothetical protein
MSDTQKQIDELRQKIKEYESGVKPLKDELNSLYRKQEDEVLALINQSRVGKHRFHDSDLVYSAGARCRCGEGLAYPNGIAVHGSWFCAGILTGRAFDLPNFKEVEHDDRFPFAFYDIKSEGQPSAQGHTTRPKS